MEIRVPTTCRERSVPFHARSPGNKGLFLPTSDRSDSHATNDLFLPDSDLPTLQNVPSTRPTTNYLLDTMPATKVPLVHHKSSFLDSMPGNSKDLLITRPQDHVSRRSAQALSDHLWPPEPPPMEIRCQTPPDRSAPMAIRVPTTSPLEALNGNPCANHLSRKTANGSPHANRSTIGAPQWNPCVDVFRKPFRWIHQMPF